TGRRGVSGVPAAAGCRPAVAQGAPGQPIPAAERRTPAGRGPGENGPGPAPAPQAGRGGAGPGGGFGAAPPDLGPAAPGGEGGGGAGRAGGVGGAAFDVASGTLTLTEAGTRRRASLHLVRGEGSLAEHQPGGLEVLEADLAAFTAVLRRANHTLKRALTDPRL